MKKVLLGTVALVLVMSVVGWATETRVMTMGNMGTIVKDEAGMFAFPSVINMYRSLVLGEVDNTGLYRVGAHYDFGEGNGVVGLYLDNRGLPLMGYQPDPEGDGATDNRLDLFYGRPFGETYFGMELVAYRDSYLRDGDDANETSVSNTAFGLRLGLTAMEEKLDVSAGFLYGTWKNVGADGEDAANQPETNMGIELMGRYWYAFNDEVTWVPHLGFNYTMGGYNDAADPASTFKSTEMGIDLGWGANITPDEHVLLLFDFGINYNSETDKADPAGGTSSEWKYSHMYLPYFGVGLEGYVTKWWDVRMGARKYWHGVSDSDPASGDEDIRDKSGSVDDYSYLGSGFHFGNLTVDIMVDPYFVLKGPNFVSGYNGQLANMASVKYAW